MTTRFPPRRIDPRPVCLTLAALALLATGGCKRQSPGAQSPGPGAAPAASTSAHSIPTIQAGAFNVAFVYVGPIGDGGWTYTHDLGRRALQQKIPDVHTAYVESVAEGADCEHVLRALARKRFDLIIATSFGYMDAMEAVAAEFPQTKFLHIAGWKQNATNFGNAFGAMEEMKYLAGMIAGGRAKADGRLQLGYIAPFPIPEVVRLINATARGARRTCPDCTMDIRWINAWVDPSREQEAAESLFAAGADVVITGADTTLPLTVAGQRGRYAIGYDSPTACDVEKARCLTSSYWRWEVLYLDVVGQIRAGTWKPSTIYGDTGSGLVGLSGFGEGETPNPQIPEGTVAEVRATLAEMRAGRFTRFDLFAGPLRDNSGRTLLAAGQKPTQTDLLGTSGCSLCMSWLAEGISGTLPRK
jgi:basic membrane protein A